MSNETELSREEIVALHRIRYPIDGPNFDTVIQAYRDMIAAAFAKRDAAAKEGSAG